MEWSAKGLKILDVVKTKTFFFLFVNILLQEGKLLVSSKKFGHVMQENCLNKKMTKNRQKRINLGSDKASLLKMTKQ